MPTNILVPFITTQLHHPVLIQARAQPHDPPSFSLRWERIPPHLQKCPQCHQHLSLRPALWTHAATRSDPKLYGGLYIHNFPSSTPLTPRMLGNKRFTVQSRILPQQEYLELHLKYHLRTMSYKTSKTAVFKNQQIR